MKLNSNLVLCVDDEAVGLQVRKILLERAGYRVLTASDGPSGLEVFSSEPVEAVASGNHDIQQKQRRGLALGIGKYLIDRQIGPDSKTRAFKMVLHQARNICIIFQHKNRLTQFETSVKITT